MLQLTNHIYSGYRTREWLHTDYMCTLVLHMDKSPILLMGKLRSRETEVIQVSDPVLD